MPNKKNVNELQELESKLGESTAVFLADYAGLSVKAQGDLRDKVREAGGELRVTKNRLLKLALTKKLTDLSPELEETLRGPNITLFAGQDPVAPLKALVQFAKGSENDKPAVRIGVLGQEVLSLTKVKQLASLPGKNELIAKLMYTIKAPLSGMVNVLAAPTRNLVYALAAIKDKKV